MKCKLKIAFVGSHGTGKSSGATFLASVLKKENREFSVKNIEENVRELAPLFGGKLNTYEFQRLAMIDHLHKELTAEQIYDIIVCDRAAIDTLIYGLTYGIKLPSEYFTLALHHMNTFNHVFFIRPDSSQSELTKDGFRDVDVKQRNEVDAEFEKILKLWGGNYTEVRSAQIYTFPYLEKINEK